MIRPGRFESKVVVIIIAVVLIPLLAAIIVGQGMLRENYKLGLNQRVLERVQRQLLLQKRYIELTRDHAEQGAAALARDARVEEAAARANTQRLERLFAEALAANPSIVALRAFDDSGTQRAVSPDTSPAPQGAATRADRPAKAVRLKTVSHQLSNDWRIEADLAAPEALLREYQRMGQFAQDFSVLVAGSRYISNRYLAIYAALAVLALVVALALALILARQITRRLTLLAEATQRVGAGEANVQVPVSGDDEIADLTVAFNAMVRQMRESRDRIGYLQRVSAWQGVARRLAHEIKNPLTPIQLSVQELQQSYRGDDQEHARRLQEVREIVEEEVSALRRLVSEFSAFAKLPQVELRSADLGSFVEEAWRALRHEVEGAGITGEVRPAGRPVPVAVDAMLLRRCLDNLVRNAVHALADSPSEQRRIRITVRRLGEHGIIEVSDSGPGVSPPYQESIFDPYYTTKPEGTGLGLAIVKKVVLEHRGTIEYRDDADLGGASFMIRLPLATLDRA